MKSRATRVARCVAMALGVAASGLAADSSNSQAPVARFTATVGTEYVSVPVVVRDRKGLFVDDLSRKDFHVWVDAREVAVEAFERNVSGPVSFAILVDTSGSMGLGGKLERAKDAIRKLVTLRRPGDDFALFAFSEGQVRIVSEFSTDPADLLRQMFFLNAEGRTALFDAVVQTVNELFVGRNTKKAILLFTDGVDNASELSSRDLETVMQTESIPVFSIGLKGASFDALPESQRGGLSVAALDLIGKASGGAMFLVSDDADLRPIASEIEGELRREYVLGFEPAGEGEVRYHPIVVTVTGGGTRVVRARRGYRGSMPRFLDSPRR